jgi:hypothetical protein
MNPIDLWTTPDALAVWDREGERPEWTTKGGIRMAVTYADNRWFEAVYFDSWNWKRFTCPEAISQGIALRILRDDSRERIYAWAAARGVTVSIGTDLDGTHGIAAGLAPDGLCVEGATYDEALLAARRAIGEKP